MAAAKRSCPENKLCATICHWDPLWPTYLNCILHLPVQTPLLCSVFSIALAIFKQTIIYLFYLFIMFLLSITFPPILPMLGSFIQWFTPPAPKNNTWLLEAVHQILVEWLDEMPSLVIDTWWHLFPVWAHLRCELCGLQDLSSVIQETEMKVQEVRRS